MRLTISYKNKNLRFEKIDIEPSYSQNNMQPNSFMYEYEIEGQFPVIREMRINQEANI